MVMSDDSAHYESAIYADFESIPEAAINRWQVQRNIAFDQTLEWYRLIFDHVLDADLEARIILIRSKSDGEPVAVAPLGLTRKAALRFGIHSLRSLTNYYSSVFELVPLSANLNEDVIDELCSCLVSMNGEVRATSR